MSFLWGLTIALIVGVFIGVGIMCLMITASNADDQLLGDEQYESDTRR